MEALLLLGFVLGLREAVDPVGRCCRSASSLRR